MNVHIFVDTNILVYYRDLSEAEKQAQSEQWLTILWHKMTGRLSYQVLSEYYVTVTQRLEPGLDQETARADIRNLMSWSPIFIDRTVVEGAWSIQDRYQLSWWDSLIVSAAQKTSCDYLLTEDLQHEQQIDGLTIINPFYMAPDQIFR